MLKEKLEWTKKEYNKINSAFDTGDLTICLSLLYQTHDLYNELISPDSKNKIINKIFEGFCVGK